jgi:hypothetical protein
LRNAIVALEIMLCLMKTRFNSLIWYLHMNFAEWAEQKDVEGMPDSKQFVELACVLHRVSQREIIRAAQKFFLEHTGSMIPPHWTGKAYRMTVKKHPSIVDMNNFEKTFGERIMLPVEAFAFDEHCIAAIIKSPIACEYMPHITVATSPEVNDDYAKHLLKDRSKWGWSKEVEELYSYLLGLKRDHAYWPTIPGQLATPATLLK